MIPYPVPMILELIVRSIPGFFSFDRPIPPDPFPDPFGDVIRAVALVELAASVVLTIYVVDRLRKVTPPEVHFLLRGYACFAVLVALAISLNAFALPATPGVFVTAIGSTLLFGFHLQACRVLRRRTA